MITKVRPGRAERCMLCLGKGSYECTDGSLARCSNCNGDGYNRAECEACYGRGRVLREVSIFFGLFGTGERTVSCTECSGKGRLMNVRAPNGLYKEESKPLPNDLGFPL